MRAGSRSRSRFALARGGLVVLAGLLAIAACASDPTPVGANPALGDASTQDSPAPSATDARVDPPDVESESATRDAAPEAGSDAGNVPFSLDAIEGFGRTTLGGWQPNHDTFVVTSLDDNGPGTLRQGLDTATGPRVITFGVDGAIVLASSLLVPSNISIDGRGRQIVLQGKGLILAGTDDVILVNFAIENVHPNAEDGLRIGDPSGPSERVVVDHVRFSASGNEGDSAQVDEAISVVFGSRDITLAWLRFENWEKVLLVGNGDAPAEVDGNITLSMHHVWAKSTGRRHPQARFGIVDLWNVFLDDWHMYDHFFLEPYRESFGVQAEENARIRFEASLARRTTHAKDQFSQADDVTRCESGGKLDVIGLVITADSTAPLKQNVGCSGSTGWTRPYPVKLDAADAALRQRLETYTGNTL